ncbi:MAG: Ig-like domain-containing protein, partial [Cyclobacteriaceae bacterium]
MKLNDLPYLKSILRLGIMSLFFFYSCNQQDEGFPITNNLRVLQVNINGSTEQSGLTDQSIISELELVFSHKLNVSAFEGALTISPTAQVTMTYDSSESVVTIKPVTKFDYETDYVVGLPAGTYGNGGEKLIEDYSFSFSTSTFIAPKIALVPESLSVFEGETLNVVANIDNVIFNDVTFDLVFGGTAGDGVDYTSSVNSLVIPAGQTSASFEIEALADEDSEGKETIIISLDNVVNAVNDPPLQLVIDLGDSAPALILQGVMELDDFDLSGGQIRAVHLSVLQDIEDLSVYHIQVASNGAAADPTDIDFVFPNVAASTGDNLFVVRDADAALAATFFGSCYSSFTEFQTGGMTQNGDDAILLYKDGVAVDLYGEVGVDGTDQEWEYTNSWGYKFDEKWVYAGVGCVESSVGDAVNVTSSCSYPFCSSGLELKGIMDLNHSGNNLRAYHLFALQDIPDLSIFGAGIASNGQATSDGVEIPFPTLEVAAGENILVIRDLDVANAEAYFGSCYGK